MSAKKIGFVAITFVAVAAAIGYFFIRGHRADNSQQAWQAILKKCAESNLLGSNIVYFGASNKVGPGSVWRKAKDGSYRLFYELSDLEVDPQKRASLVVINNAVGCQGSANSQWAVNLGLPFESSTTPLKLDVSADLKRARKVSVTITGYAMDELKEGPYEDLIRNNPRLIQNLESFVIASNAIRITGFTADFDFPEGVAAELRPKYKDNFVSLKEGATLKSNWTSDTNLKMTATEPFYMLAGFSHVVLSKKGTSIIVAQKESVPADQVGSVGSDREIPIASKDIEAAIKTTLPDTPVRAQAIYIPDNQTVHLQGTVPTVEDRNDAEKVAKSLPDVQAVVNDLKVNPKLDMKAGPRF